MVGRNNFSLINAFLIIVINIYYIIIVICLFRKNLNKHKSRNFIKGT